MENTQGTVFQSSIKNNDEIPEELRAILENDGLSAAQFRGAGRLVLLGPEDEPPAAEKKAYESIIVAFDGNKRPLQLPIVVIIVDIPLVSFHEGATADSVLASPIWMQLFTTVFIDKATLTFLSLDETKWTLTPWGRAIKLHQAGHSLVKESLTSTVKPITVPDQGVLKIWAETHIIVTPDSVRIPRLCGSSIFALLLGGMSHVGWAAYVGDIRDFMKTRKDLFELAQINPESCFRAAELKMRTTNAGNVIEVMTQIRLLVWWMVINAAIKRQSTAKVIESMNKRLKAICDMARIKQLIINIDDESVAEIGALRDHIRPILALLVRPLFLDTVAPLQAHLSSLNYIRLMFSGYEMSSFLIINMWLSSPVKTAAHVDASILDEAVAYRKMYDAVLAACKDHPIECYKLLHPHAELIIPEQIKRLRYCSIKWRRSQDDSWSQFAAVVSAGNDNTARLDALMARKLNLKTTNSISTKHIDVAKLYNIPVLPDGRLDVVDQTERLPRCHVTCKIWHVT